MRSEINFDKKNSILLLETQTLTYEHSYVGLTSQVYDAITQL